jgi:hypothetical protein
MPDTTSFSPTPLPFPFSTNNQPQAPDQASAMKQYRLNRLFNPKSGNCLDVAIDHGVFNVLGFLQGIENIEKTMDTLIACAPDAIQLNVRPSRARTNRRW